MPRIAKGESQRYWGALRPSHIGRQPRKRKRAAVTIAPVAYFGVSESRHALPRQLAARHETLGVVFVNCRFPEFGSTGASSVAGQAKVAQASSLHCVETASWKLALPYGIGTRPLSGPQDQ